MEEEDIIMEEDNNIMDTAMIESSDKNELFKAIDEGNINLSIQLINSNTIDLEEIDEYGDNVLSLACRNEMEEVAFALIAKGLTNPGIVNNDGDTALLYAALN